MHIPMCITELCQCEYNSLFEIWYGDVTTEKYGRCQARLLSKCQPVNRESRTPLGTAAVSHSEQSMN
jgi:hypothetical protein